MDGETLKTFVDDNTDSEAKVYTDGTSVYTGTGTRWIRLPP